MIDVVVLTDLQTLKDQLRTLFPAAPVEAVSLNGAIVLRGRVPSTAVAEQAMQVAAPYGTKVLNLMEVAGIQQVMLQVRFAEVSRSASSALGVNMGYSDGASFAASNIGQVSPLGIKELKSESSGLAVLSPNPSISLFGAAAVGDSTLAYFISALRQNNLLRILAEPNLIATSGQEASFLAGGEFPIPVTQSGGNGGNSISIEYREFGVRLNFVPQVLGDGRIRLKVAPEVSDLDFTTSVRLNGFVVPGLSSRKVTTTIELGEGQTFAIAGLLNNNVTATKDVTPVLGDLPVLGALFRSVRYQRKETELVVLVTPRLVAGLNPGQVPPLPGEDWRHPSEPDLLLKGDIGGERAKTGPTTAPSSGTRPPRYYGQHGFVPVAAQQADAR
jgi:pilus assembly protein CpaC